MAASRSKQRIRFSNLIPVASLCLALLALTPAAPAAGRETSAPPVFIVAAVAEPPDAAGQWDAAESRSQHAARTNHRLMAATVSVLALFVLGRVLLLWQIARNRKKLARENLLETQP